MSTEQTLERWPVSIDIPVAWGEMDAFQHVNNVAYLRYVESARIAYFEATGMMERMKATGIGPILARASIDYRRPVVYPDRLRVACTVSSIGNSSFVMKYKLESEKLSAVVAEAETVAVMVDYRSGQKVAVDEVLRSAIAALEASAK